MISRSGISPAMATGSPADGFTSYLRAANVRSATFGTYREAAAGRRPGGPGVLQGRGRSRGIGRDQMPTVVAHALCAVGVAVCVVNT
jgi:hypothetical protein